MDRKEGHAVSTNLSTTRVSLATKWTKELVASMAVVRSGAYLSSYDAIGQLARVRRWTMIRWYDRSV